MKGRAVVQYYHAHQVNPRKCRGHMNCMRRCPTQAIRVRNGTAVIHDELCIDCGTCISVCPSAAIDPVINPLQAFSGFKYKVVVPSSALYAQFDSSIHPWVIHQAFRRLGFDLVVNVGLTCEYLAKATTRYLDKYTGPRPVISSECPCVIRLIQVRYPDLVGNIIRLDVRRELTARGTRRSLMASTGLGSEEIGIIYISPCPAKVVSIEQPAEKEQSWFNGAVAIRDVYALLYPIVMGLQAEFDEGAVPEDFFFRAGWPILGGITQSLNMDNWLAVSGLDHVMKIFDDIENSRLRNVDYVEAVACMMGCVGGIFNVENPYVARANNIRQRTRYEKGRPIPEAEIERRLTDGDFALEHSVPPRPTKYFDTDLETSIKRLREVDRIFQKLHQIDCGVCGAPTCKAFAEDCARGDARLTDCVFLSNRGGAE
ncbi:MAG TPA: [Fe-Fe] hydrogenase large subunit C-terminal domain-containing protein [candidate division Zixibacteria bacterium]|nr:[Fe-Fe] hydrogenase large subunit C-terminal domain-containing protein [candidate division Zixibacteria bacterium]HPM38671.1 [Fe-Fe] hydrogenase large subunit C-terminal domain-containing protein [candidate division Zixibacteria bacterium]